jgi:hypothetical protein
MIIRNARVISWENQFVDDDFGLIALATGCAQLQSLNISECRNITDAGREIAERINYRK